MLLSDDVIEKWCYSALAHMEIQGAGRGEKGDCPLPQLRKQTQGLEEIREARPCPHSSEGEGWRSR